MFSPRLFERRLIVRKEEWSRRNGVRKSFVENMFDRHLKLVIILISSEMLAMLENSFELDDIDKKTVIVMIGLPVLLNPLYEC